MAASWPVALGLWAPSLSRIGSVEPVRDGDDVGTVPASSSSRRGSGLRHRRAGCSRPRCRCQAGTLPASSSSRGVCVAASLSPRRGCVAVSSSRRACVWPHRRCRTGTWGPGDRFARALCPLIVARGLWAHVAVVLWPHLCHVEALWVRAR